MIETKNKYFHISSRFITILLAIIFFVDFSAVAQKNIKNKKTKKNLSAVESLSPTIKKTNKENKEIPLISSKHSFSDTNVVSTVTGPDIESYKEKIKQMISWNCWWILTYSTQVSVSFESSSKGNSILVVEMRFTSTHL